MSVILGELHIYAILVQHFVTVVNYRHVYLPRVRAWWLPPVAGEVTGFGKGRTTMLVTVGLLGQLRQFYDDNILLNFAKNVNPSLSWLQKMYFISYLHGHLILATKSRVPHGKYSNLKHLGLLRTYITMMVCN